MTPTNTNGNTTGPTPGHASGFSLVELLVVIGIIALLIGILLPALSGAKQVANRVKCLANLNQIGTFMTIYANDNRGLLIPLGPLQDGVQNAPGMPPVPGQDGLPHPETLSTGQVAFTYQTLGTNVYPWTRWPAAVIPGHYPVPTASDIASQPVPEPPGDAMGQFATPWTSPIMACPSDPQAGAAHSYLFNQHLVENQNQVLTYSRPAPTGKTNSDVVLLGEKRTGVDDYYMEVGDFPINGVQPKTLKVELYRHGTKLGSNYLYKDMHAEPSPPNALSAFVDPWDINPIAPTAAATP